MKANLFIVLVFFTLFQSCSEKSNNCENLETLINLKLDAVTKYYKKISEWNDSYTRMKTMKRSTDRFKVGFQNIRNSIDSGDEKNFEKNVLKLKEKIDNFLFWNEKIEPWVNNEYFWIIRETSENLADITLSEQNCSALTKIKILEMEERLISTFYMMGYNDQYCFNQIQMEFKAVESNTIGDSVSYSMCIFAYDTNQLVNHSVLFSNQNITLKDSTKGKLTKIPRFKGVTTISGSAYFNMYGKQMEKKFEDQIILK